MDSIRAKICDKCFQPFPEYWGTHDCKANIQYPKARIPQPEPKAPELPSDESK